MKTIDRYLIKPVGERYNNVKQVGSKKLIINSEISNHEYINREAKLVVPPINSDLKPGDKLIVHHNIFRRWYDVRGVEKNSRSYFKDDLYFCWEDQIFLVDKGNGWQSYKDFCFVMPLKETNTILGEKEAKLKGLVIYPNSQTNKGDIIGFTPECEFEFIINNQRLYRIHSTDISIQYEHKGNEEAYNPSWA